MRTECKSAAVQSPQAQTENGHRTLEGKRQPQNCMSDGKQRKFKRESSFNCVASRRWCYGFIERYGFSIRRKNTIAQKLPQDYEKKLVRLQHSVIAQGQGEDMNLSLKTLGTQTKHHLSLTSWQIPQYQKREERL